MLNVSVFELSAVLAERRATLFSIDATGIHSQISLKTEVASRLCILHAANYFNVVGLLKIFALM